MSLDTLATLLLALYALIAFIDGVGIHLVMLRLHAHQETYREHAVHSIRAVLFAASLPLLFVYHTSGVWLWIGVLLMSIDLVMGGWDAWMEREARAALGGLGQAESMIHITASVIHGGMLALILASRGAGDWLYGSTGLGSMLPHGALVVEWILPGSVFLAVAHCALLHPAMRSWRCERCWGVRA